MLLFTNLRLSVPFYVFVPVECSLLEYVPLPRLNCEQVVWVASYSRVLEEGLHVSFAVVVVGLGPGEAVPGEGALPPAFPNPGIASGLGRVAVAAEVTAIAVEGERTCLHPGWFDEQGDTNGWPFLFGRRWTMPTGVRVLEGIPPAAGSGTMASGLRKIRFQPRVGLSRCIIFGTLYL